MTADPVATLASVLDPAFADFDATDVLDVDVITEQVTFTADGAASPAEWARVLHIAPASDAARWVPPLGRVRVDPDEPCPVFDAVEAGWRWRTRTGRASPKRRTFAAYVAEARAGSRVRRRA